MLPTRERLDRLLLTGLLAGLVLVIVGFVIFSPAGALGVLLAFVTILFVAVIQARARHRYGLVVAVLLSAAVWVAGVVVAGVASAQIYSDRQQHHAVTAASATLQAIGVAAGALGLVAFCASGVLVVITARRIAVPSRSTGR